MNVQPMMQVWADMAIARPEAPALTVGRHPSVGWRELQDRSNRLARLLAEKGVVKGDFVTLALSMSEFAVVGLLATIKLGATPNTISAALPAREVEQLIELVRPRVVLTQHPEQFAGQNCVVSEQAADGLDGTDLPVVVSPSYKAPTSGGSTGRPKIILSGSPATIDDSPDSMLRSLGFPVDDSCIFAGPLYHNTALLGSLVTLSLRNHLVVEERFDPELTLELIERHRAIYMIAVPTMMSRIWQLPEAVRRRYDMSSMRYFTHNAAPCPDYLKRAWIDWLGADRVFENYTATEHSAQTLVTGEEWLRKPGTVGKVITGEVEVRDDEGNRLPAGEVGNIWMRRPEGTPRTFTYIGQETPDREDRWETVGDMGYFDEDGYLFLADRRKDLVISGGANIYPAEVEEALSARSDIAECVVIGLPDPDMGQLVHAIVRVREGARPPEAVELDQYMRSMIAGYKCPRSYDFVTAPLRNDAGKVRRSALQEERAQSDNWNRIRVERKTHE